MSWREPTIAEERALAEEAERRAELKEAEEQRDALLAGLKACDKLATDLSMGEKFTNSGAMRVAVAGMFQNIVRPFIEKAEKHA